MSIPARAHAETGRSDRAGRQAGAEVNADHALVKKLDGSVHFHDLAHIPTDQALLAEAAPA